MWIIGVAKEDMALMGQLLGIKLAVSEFIGYMQLAELKDISNLVHLQYEKSIIMATYMLCGFANFASIGIQIGWNWIIGSKPKNKFIKIWNDCSSWRNFSFTIISYYCWNDNWLIFFNKLKDIFMLNFN